MTDPWSFSDPHNNEYKPNIKNTAVVNAKNLNIGSSREISVILS